MGSIGVLFAQTLEWKPAEFQLQTRWSKEVSPTNALSEYPRPQMVLNLTPNPVP